MKKHKNKKKFAMLIYDFTKCGIEMLDDFVLLFLQAYSYRNVLPILSKKNRAIAFDWLGKPNAVTFFVYARQ